MKKIARVITCLLSLCMLTACNPANRPPTPADTRSSLSGKGLPPGKYENWPTEDYKTATPESQGVDSGVLYQRLEKVIRKNVQPDSLLIMRNGYLIHESYFHGYDKDTVHGVYSITKSVLSALVGIAIAEGRLAGVDQKVQDFFPNVTLPDGLQFKREMTIQHLLTMTSGIQGDRDWNEQAAEGGIGESLFALPQKTKPGEAFFYDAAATHLLGIIVSRATGKPLFDYAKEKLFEPLGMDSVIWPADRDGNYYGGDGINMTPRDMLRFGYLYLNGGRWEDRQIIPAEWVAQTPPQRSASDAYGRLFWANQDNPEDGYEARGAHGQTISVFPALDMVIVVTNSGNENRKYLYEEIRRGIQQDPLPEQPQVQEKIKRLISRSSPQPPDATGLQKKITVKKTQDIDLHTLRMLKKDGEALAFSETEQGWSFAGGSLSSQMETQETFRFPLMVTIQYIPQEDSLFKLVFRKGEMGIDHQRGSSVLWVCDFMNGRYSAYAPKSEFPAGREVTVQWILHSDFQAVTANGEILLYSTDSPYMHTFSFLRNRKAPVRLAADIKGVTVQRITVSELE